MLLVMVVGGDRLKYIIDCLEGEGFNEVIYLDGCKSNMVKWEIFEYIGFVLVIMDFINYNMVKVIKEKVKK